MTRRGHPFPHAVHVRCAVQLVILLVGVRGVALRNDESGQDGSRSFVGGERGERKANVVPVDHLMDKVAKEVAVQGSVQQGVSHGGARIVGSHNLPRKGHSWAPRPEVLHPSLTQPAEWARPVRRRSWYEASRWGAVFLPCLLRCLVKVLRE